jgi:predicted RND superfamily exporter protein
MMDLFARLVIRLRVPILVATVVISVVLGSFLTSLRQDYDVLAFLPADDPDIVLFHRVSEQFGGLDVAIVGVESPRLLTTDGIARVRAITRGALDVAGVYHTLSFTEMTRLASSEEEFTIEPFVPDEVPGDQERIAEIRRFLHADDMVAGRFVSRDGRSGLILCFLRPDASMADVASGLRETARRHAGRMRLYFGGLPFIQDHIGGGTRRDLVRLTPYVLLLAVLATFVFFRRPLGALLVMSAVALGAVWTMGGMGALDVPMTVISTSLPMVLVAIGGAYGAHVLAGFYVAPGATAPERVRSALCEVGPPVIGSVLTTIVGFASFLVMDVVPMRTFGIIASIGVAACALVALVVVPAVLSFDRGGPGRAPAERLADPIWRMCRAMNRYRVAALVGVGAIAAVATFLARGVTPNTEIRHFFRSGSEPALADRFLRDNFGGSMFVQVSMRADMRDPVVLDALRAVAEEAATIDGVTRVTTHLDTLERLAAGLGGLPRLPRTPGQVGGLQNFMSGNPALRQLVDDGLTRALVQVTIGTRDTRVVDHVVGRLERFLAEHVPSSLIVVDVHGDGPRVDGARARRLRLVAARVDRLLRAGDQPPRDDAARRIEAVLRRRFGSWTLAPGADLDRAVVAAVSGFFDSDDSPFEPFDATSAGARLTTLARTPVPPERLAAALPPLVPAEVAADDEGMRMAVPVLAARISETRARVVAERCLRDVLAAAGAAGADGALRERVRGALEELDDPRVGVPGDGPEAIAIETGVTGTAVINRAFRASTYRNVFRSLFATLAALLVLGVVMFASVKTGVVAVLPSALTLLLTFGIMGLMSTPLDPGTCMVASLSMGIGIDYAVHFLWRRRWRGLSLEQTCRNVGPSIVFNAVEVASGFAVMIAADTVPLSRFGLLVMAAMLIATIATFTILPALTRLNAPGGPDIVGGEDTGDGRRQKLSEVARRGA